MARGSSTPSDSALPDRDSEPGLALKVPTRQGQARQPFRAAVSTFLAQSGLVAGGGDKLAGQGFSR